MLVTTTTSTATLARVLMKKVKKSINRATPHKFSLFPSIFRVKYMSACLIKNLRFFKFSTETDSLKKERALLENINPIVI